MYDEKEPRNSKFRCRFCHKNYDRFNFALQYRPALADAKIYNTAQANLRAIRDHVVTKGKAIDFTDLNDGIKVL